MIFTTCVITASAILFREFDSVSLKDWVGLICGFLIVLTAIVLLHFCKNFDVTLAQLAQQIHFTSNKDDEDEIQVDLDNTSSNYETSRRVLNEQRAHSEVNFRLLGTENQKDLGTYGTTHGRI